MSVDVPKLSKVNKICLKYLSQYQDSRDRSSEIKRQAHLPSLSLVTNIKEAETWITYSPCTIIAGVNIPDFFFRFSKI